MRYTTSVSKPWQPGPCSTVPSKFQSFGIDSDPTGMLNMGSLISTVLMGPRPLDEGAASAAGESAPADVEDVVAPADVLVAWPDRDTSPTTTNATTTTAPEIAADLLFIRI